MNAYELEQMTILDIASTLEVLMPLEIDAYAIGISGIGQVFLGEQPFGLQRSRGVLWVPGRHYETLVERVQTLMLTDQLYPQQLERQLRESLARTVSATEACAASTDRLPELWDSLCSLLGFVAFNWLLPRDGFLSEICTHTGLSQEAAAAWLLQVSVPTSPPHYLTFQAEQIQLARRLKRGDAIDPVAFANDWGSLAGDGIFSGSPDSEHTYRDPAFVTSKIQSLADAYSLDELIYESERICNIHASARTRYAQALSYAFALATQTQGDLRALERIARLMSLAAEAEEQRHIVQIRARSVIHNLVKQRGIPDSEATPERLGLRVPLESTAEFEASLGDA